MAPPDSTGHTGFKADVSFDAQPPAFTAHRFQHSVRAAGPYDVGSPVDTLKAKERVALNPELPVLGINGETVRFPLRPVGKRSPFFAGNA